MTYRCGAARSRTWRIPAWIDAEIGDLASLITGRNTRLAFGLRGSALKRMEGLREH